jgi:hypothetical protein
MPSLAHHIFLILCNQEDRETPGEAKEEKDENPIINNIDRSSCHRTSAGTQPGQGGRLV